jgi:putative CocE/NonD family hydrolase
LLEYLPYRTADLYAERDASLHGWFARHGYAGARVDIRGTGNSEGWWIDEYSEQELNDGVEVIAWLAEQPWCSGAVGMMGLSYGGFNSIQLASKRPPALKAVISIGSADDRFDQDVHRIGGCVHDEGLVWGVYAAVIPTMPPDPEVVGDRWRELWRERTTHWKPPIETWLTHQRKNGYWKRASVASNYDSIRCAVYMVGGWADRYRDSVLTMLESCSAPCKGVIGPWEHAWPHEAGNGPRIDFLTEARRWFDHWLKHEETGIMAEPRLRVRVNEWAPPSPRFADRPGQWLAEEGWPSTRIERVSWFPSQGRLMAEKPAAIRHEIVKGCLFSGVAAGDSCAFRVPGSDLAGDQRVEDGLSLTFDGEPLEQELVLLGVPTFEVAFTADKPNALMCVRLCDVAPDGSSLLITRGLLNLTHRHDPAAPVPLDPGRREVATISMMACGHVLAAGHRLRLGISPAYTWAWPSPEISTLQIETGPHTRLMVPIRRGTGPGDGGEPFGPAAGEDSDASGQPGTSSPAPGAGSSRTIIYDPAAGRLERRTETTQPKQLLVTGNWFEVSTGDTWWLVADQPLDTRANAMFRFVAGRGEWTAQIECTTEVCSDATTFRTQTHFVAYEGDQVFDEKTVSTEIPRDHL